MLLQIPYRSMTLLNIIFWLCHANSMFYVAFDLPFICILSVRTICIIINKDDLGLEWACKPSDIGNGKHENEVYRLLKAFRRRREGAMRWNYFLFLEFQQDKQQHNNKEQNWSFFSFLFENKAVLLNRVVLTEREVIMSAKRAERERGNTHVLFRRSSTWI